MNDLNLYLHCYNYSKDKDQTLKACLKANPNFNISEVAKYIHNLQMSLKRGEMQYRKDSR